MTLVFALLLWMGSQQQHKPELKCFPRGGKCRVLIDGNLYEAGGDPDLATSPTTTFICYKRASGFCQFSPLTEADKQADANDQELTKLLQELAERRDLKAGDVLRLWSIVENRWSYSAESEKRVLEELRKLKADESGGKHCIKFPKEQP